MVSSSGTLRSMGAHAEAGVTRLGLGMAPRSRLRVLITLSIRFLSPALTDTHSRTPGPLLAVPTQLFSYLSGTGGSNLASTPPSHMLFCPQPVINLPCMCSPLQQETHTTLPQHCRRSCPNNKLAF